MTKKSEHSDIEEIIIDSLVGNISESNLKKLDEWRRQSDKNEQSYIHLKKVWETNLGEPKYINYNALEERIIEGGFGQNSRRKTSVLRIPLFYKIAAAFAIFLSVLAVYRMNFVDSNIERETNVAFVEVITKYNPRGQKSRIILPDNSVVWLNSDSKLTYQKGFTDSLRYLELEGEAYFDVERDVNRPFVVQSGPVRTIAVGTSFNIRDYPEEPSINVALLSGKVRIVTDLNDDNDYLLDPNQQLELTKKAEFINKEAFEQDGVSIWKDGRIHFRKNSFEFVVRTLERSYDVTIDASNYSGDNWSYTGEFDNMSLELILKRIGFSEGFEFKIDGKQIILTDKL